MRQIVLLFALIIFSSIGTASATGYSHNLSNSNGELDSYSAGIPLIDTVTPVTGNFDGYMMRFLWEFQDTVNTEQISYIYILNDKYVDSIIPTKTGTWKVKTQEYVRWISPAQKHDTRSEKTFSVIQAPEFGSLGFVAPLFMIGLLYIGLRKRML